MNTYAGRSEKPDNVTIFRNTLTGHFRGISLGRSYTANGGDNCTIHNNIILNSFNPLDIASVNIS